MRRCTGVSRALRWVVLAILVMGAVGPGLVRAQGEISTVIPAPDLPGVPGDVPVVGFTTLDLAGGEYQWQTTSRQTIDRDDEPIETHSGFLLSLDQAITVLKAGAPSRPIPAGNSLPLAEGDRVKPVASGETPGNIVIVEFVAVEEIGPDESPDQVLPVTLDPGTYTIALLDITNLGEDGPSPGQVIVEAAGPGFAISSTDSPTADTPAVVWLASIFRTGEASADVEPDAEASPTDDAEPDAEPTDEPDPTRASDPDDEDDIATPEADDEDDADTPESDDEENGLPTLEPTAVSDDDDAGDEAGDTQGAPVLPGVPDDIPVLTFTVLELPAGDYQWQTRSMTTLSRTDTPINVHDGFLIAVDQPVIVLKAGAPSLPVQPGSSIVLEDGDRILPTTSGETPGNIVIVELVAVAEVGADETPDEVLPLTLEDGVYTLALLDISGVGEDGPAPGEIIAEAAGPGFGISAAEETGETSDPEELDWLVSIFPAGEETTGTPAS